jgi:uracil-DNA glycosylase
VGLQNFKLLNILLEEQQKDYFKHLMNNLEGEYLSKTIYPKKENIFNAFNLIESDLKVVILGQDPYHQPNQAQGLAFSTPRDIKNPPSMVNILKGIESDLGKPSKCIDGDLTSWAKQGVLLLNTILTVEDSKPKSHEKLGWYEFSDNIIKEISDNFKNVVFILWGGPAHKKEGLIDCDKHLIIKEVHPSPLSAYRGFFHSKQFSDTNKYLKLHNKTPIQW